MFDDPILSRFVLCFGLICLLASYFVLDRAKAVLEISRGLLAKAKRLNEESANG